ncbi:MAG: DEAD/DEAH box helicase [Eubacteriales bacterium]|nr:DEAD/DEAH box helicase [Eubacteriales bacterium]
MKIKDVIKDPRVIRAIETKGYTEFTPIQAEIIPLIQNGSDVIGQSQTGTGKTAAFAIPLIEKIDEKLRKPQILVVTPTRELAVQVAKEFQSLVKYCDGVRSLAVYGGEPIGVQIRGIKDGAQIIVGTPGRLMDHLKRKTLRFDDLRCVVIDEADEMLRMGFRQDIEQIFASISGETQRLLFSATMPKPILQITGRFLSNAAHVKIQTDSVVTDTIHQTVVAIQRDDKKDALYRILETKNPERGIIFCNTKRMVDKITSELQRKGFSADHIHGDMKQTHRMQVLRQFNDGHLKYLVATDVAARGLDIHNVDLVVNYDLPDMEEHYVHRIGRSGRAGKEGESVSLITHGDSGKLREIERYMDRKVQRAEVPSLQSMNQAKVEQFIVQMTAVMDRGNLEDYLEIVDHIEELGYSTRDLAAALLAKNLLLQRRKERDINDPSVFQRFKQRRKPFGKKKYFKKHRR